MALLGGTTESYDIGTAGGIREDLEDVIWDLFADDTYCLTNLDKTDCNSTYHEWELDSLGGVTVNRALEGDDGNFATLSAPTRVGNYLQISRKDFLVSGTLEEVKKAGRKSEVARAAMKKMRELKNDMEYAIVRNQASSAGGQATARSSASMESWIATNETLATTTASADTVGFSSGTVAAPTDGSTTGAFTESALKTALAAAWSQGGNASVILVGTARKTDISGFAGIATKYNEIKGAKQATIIGAADMYVSDVGNHSVVLHRHVRANVVLAIDPEYWSVGFLRRPRMETLAKTGDGEKRMLLAEWTLISRNQAASAKVVAIT